MAGWKDRHENLAVLGDANLCETFQFKMSKQHEIIRMVEYFGKKNRIFYNLLLYRYEKE
jgi:hypothetical protein